MLIMLSSQEETLESQPSPRFGRAPFFIRYDCDQQTFEALPNPAVAQGGGAGVAATQFLIDHGANVAISGRFGPNAHQALKAAGIRMFVFRAGLTTIAKVIDMFEQDQLEEIL